jgi:drug/metabolite transporter (DMT)-like permease
MKSRSQALGLLFTCALLWSTGGVLIKSLDWNPFWIAGGRSLIAVILLWIWYRRFTFTWSFPQVGGALAYALTVVLFVVANKLTTAANAIVLQYTAPIYVALFSFSFLGEKATRWDWVTIGVALSGMVLFFFDQLTLGHMWGNILAILSGVTFGWLVLFLRKQKDQSTVESIFLGNVFAVLLCIPFINAQDTPHHGGWIFLGLGIFQLTLPYILYAKAIRHVQALEAMMIPLIEPILNPLWVLLWIGERPGPMAMMGSIIILGTLLFRNLMPFLFSRTVKEKNSLDQAA